MFFECRLDQLSSDLSTANAQIERLRADLAQASLREVQLKQELASAESRAGLARRERDEALKTANAARAERERFLDKLIEAERIRRAGDDCEEGIDLAAFIAELRSEVLHLRATVQASPAFPQSSGQSAMANHLPAAAFERPIINRQSAIPVDSASLGPFSASLATGQLLPGQAPVVNQSMLESRSLIESQPVNEDLSSIESRSSAAEHQPATGQPAPLGNRLLASETRARINAPISYKSVQEAGVSLASQGRLGIGEREREALKANARFDTRSEETLFSLSLRELSSTDSASRTRAAQRLKTLGPRSALPAVAASLNAEQDEQVTCALLEVCAAAGDSSVLPIVEARFSSASVEIRLAALEAAFRLHDHSCLTRMLDDASVRVRRRVAILAAGQVQTVTVLQRAAQDLDPSVRRVAALGLAAIGGQDAVLLSALDDADTTVRRAAAKGLSRRFGPSVFAVADLDSARRRREIRRLTSSPVSSSVVEPDVVSTDRRPVVSQIIASSSLIAEPGVESSRPRTDHSASVPPQAPASAPSSVSANSIKPVESPNPGLESEILTQVYSALRGQTDNDLTRNLNASPEHVLTVASTLVQRGKLIRRGQRYFVP